MFEKLMKMLNKFKNHNHNNTDLMPMSKILTDDINLLRLDLSLGKPQNSICAEEFNRLLFERTNLNAIGSYFYGDLNKHIKIVVWVNEDEFSERLLKNKHFCNLYSNDAINDRYFVGNCQCMLDALKVHSFEHYKKL